MNQNDWPPHGGTVERLARLEEAGKYARDRLNAHSARIDSIDQQLRGVRAKAVSALAMGERITAVEAQFKHAEERMRSMRDRATYALAAMLFGAVATGNVTLDQIINLLTAARALLRGSAQ